MRAYRSAATNPRRVARQQDPGNLHRGARAPAAIAAARGSPCTHCPGAEQAVAHAVARASGICQQRINRYDVSFSIAFLFLVNASRVSLMQIVAGFGSAAVAEYTIAVRIIIFLILPVWGLSNDSATLVR